LLIIEDKISESVKQYGIIPIFILSILLDLIPQYISPHILAVIGNFFDINMILVITVMVIGSIIGSMTGFEIGSRLKKSNLIVDFVGKKKTKKFEESINKKGKYIVSLAAISPLPYIPLIIGMIHMKRRNFIFYGVIPRIIGLIVIGLLTYGIFV